METIGVVLSTIIANMRTEELLQQSQSLTQELQSQSEELQSQQEELKRSNAELEEQAKSLKASEELLQTQQEELQQTNEELQEKAALLERQNRDIEIKNREIELARALARGEGRAARAVLEVQERVPREHVARAAHAAQLAADPVQPARGERGRQPDGEAGRVRADDPQSGSDLLALINDILDLSKVEAGKMDVHPAHVGARRQVRDYVERTFRPVADEKELGFDISIADDVPPSVETDEQRLQQILKNLLSNAFKFTEYGRRRRCGSSARRPTSRYVARGPREGRQRDRVLGVGLRHRHPRRQAAADLRGLPAGRRHDEPQVRRHRPRACRSRARSRACSAARSARSRRSARAATFTLYLPENFTPIEPLGRELDSETAARPEAAT